MKMFREGMNEDFYLECSSCGGEFYSTNEDDLVSGFCTMCQEFGSDYSTDLGLSEESDYCNCEDYPCCGH